MVHRHKTLEDLTEGWEPEASLTARLPLVLLECLLFTQVFNVQYIHG